MRPTQYQNYIDTMCTSPRLTGYRTILSSLSTLDMEQRSAISKLCRAQCFPPKSSRLRKLTNSLSSHQLREILPLCQTPLLAGLVLQLVLLAPMSDHEIDCVYTQSMLKEMTVMESVKRECTLNFEPFFGDYESVVHPLIPSNPRMARHIHGCIESWIESLKGRVLFPRVGSKTVSKATARELTNIDFTYIPNSEIGITPIDLERVYHQYGIQVLGPCEMRQKWYCSNLQPRTYFAQGGTAYHTSKYLANPFTMLCDTLPATNRRTRVEPGRIVIRNPTDDVAYYDLTSFTSNLHVQSVFMFTLARYCSGIRVQLLDSVYGIIDEDLGHLIYEYTKHNLQQPSYTIPSRYGNPYTEHYHSIAGFLGVYGNIATATFIHGIVMSMQHTYLDENNVAGDDGLVVTDDVSHTLNVVNTMGVVMDEKTFRDSEGCCIHLKRPITRSGTGLIHGQLVTWPSLEPGQHIADNRYPYLKNLSNRERRDTMASSVTAFLRKLEHQRLDVSDIDLIDAFLTRVYSTYNLPREGCVPQITQIDSGFVPIYEKRFIGVDPLYNTISRHYENIAKLPLRGKVGFTDEMINDTTFRCNTTTLLRHLVILGYLEQDKVSTCVFGYEGLQQLLKEYTDPEPPIYEYTVLAKLPEWVEDYLVSNSK